VVSKLAHRWNLPTPSADVAAVYIRCDVDTVGEVGKGPPEYGLLPHRFISDRLPAGVSKIVLLLGKRGNKCVLCPKVIADLTSHLEQLRLAVEVLEPSSGPPEVDWARLATFRTVFSWPSTFSFTALMGSGAHNRVFFPYNGARMLFVSPPRDVPEIQRVTPANFSWVETDYLPGRALAGLRWEQIQKYLRSQFCDTSVVPCVPLPASC